MNAELESLPVEENADSADAQSRPLWIPILGYIVLSSGMVSLAEMVGNWFSHGEGGDLGFLGIWIGVGLIQYHWGSAKVFSGMLIFIGIFTLIFTGLALDHPNEIEGTNWFPGWTYGMLATTLLVGLICVSLTAVTATCVLRAKRHFSNEEAHFSPRDIPLRQVPVAVALTLLAAGYGIARFQWNEREDLIQHIDHFEFLVYPIDAETGELLVGATSFSLGECESPGMARFLSMTSVTGGMSYEYLATPPLTVNLTLKRDGYEEREVSIVLEHVWGNQPIEVKMRKIRPLP